jgi:hypothetical protein
MENIFKKINFNKKIILSGLTFSIIFLVFLIIFLSGKNHVETTNKVIQLNEKTIKLTDSVVNLVDEHKSINCKLKSKDSILSKQNEVISSQNENLNQIKKQFDKVKSTPIVTQTIYIHDTVIIVEKKNFWGKTKKTIQQNSSVDSLSIFLEEDSI